MGWEKYACGSKDWFIEVSVRGDGDHSTGFSLLGLINWSHTHCVGTYLYRQSGYFNLLRLIPIVFTRLQTEWLSKWLISGVFINLHVKLIRWGPLFFEVLHHSTCSTYFVNYCIRICTCRSLTMQLRDSFISAEVQYPENQRFFFFKHVIEFYILMHIR